MRLRKYSSLWVGAWLKVTSFSAVLLAVPASHAAAQTCPATAATSSGSTVTASLCMQVKDVMAMTVTGGLTPPGTLKQAHFTSSATSAAASVYVPYGGSLDIAVASNREFSVTVEGAFSGPATKNPADALWSITSGTFTATAQNLSPLTVASLREIPFPSRLPNAAVSRTVYFASRWIFENDRPGAYALTVKLTLAPK